MKRVFGTLLVIAIALLAALLLFVYSGVYNVAASEPHTRAVRWLLETTRNQSIIDRAEAVITPTDLNSEQRTVRGARLYASMCQLCHLAPGVEPTALHRGLNPQPPRLSAEASEHSSRYLFWTTKHGIKMTGMPAWGETHSDEELWDIVAFIKELPVMTAAQYQAAIQAPAAASHPY
ncbi:c-type cytochrome [Massilia glaciei]|uniref:Cytochrome c n=1 Tax=Massilia glaciei TaxID=1524097 RepID=A0A2U2I7A0_9BURK|nr:cytochrome c [Massilia glaciei]PWF55623.1 cytochrome c [Massilia glaciei]